MLNACGEPDVPKPRTRDEVRRSTDGPPFKLSELAVLSGLSKRTLLYEVERGQLPARSRGARFATLVAYADGKLYLQRLGAL